MRDRRPLWISLLAVVAVAVVALVATLSAGWSPKLGLDLAGGLSVVYETHTPVTDAELDTIITILNERVGSGSSGATVSSQGSSKCPDGTHSCALIGASIPGQKNTRQILATAGEDGPAVLPTGALLRTGVLGGQGPGRLDRRAPDLLVDDGR